MKVSGLLLVVLGIALCYLSFYGLGLPSTLPVLPFSFMGNPIATEPNRVLSSNLQLGKYWIMSSNITNYGQLPIYSEANLTITSVVGKTIQVAQTWIIGSGQPDLLTFDVTKIYDTPPMVIGANLGMGAMIFGDVENNVLTIFNVTSTRTIQVAGEGRTAVGLVLTNRKIVGIQCDRFEIYFDKTTGIALEGTMIFLSGAVSIYQRTITTNLFVPSPPPNPDDILAIINSILALKGVKQLLLIIGIPMIPIGCLVVLRKKDPESLPY